jgi:hypothetical protein
MHVVYDIHELYTTLCILCFDCIYDKSCAFSCLTVHAVNTWFPTMHFCRSSCLHVNPLSPFIYLFIYYLFIYLFIYFAFARHDLRQPVDAIKTRRAAPTHNNWAPSVCKAHCTRHEFACVQAVAEPIPVDTAGGPSSWTTTRVMGSSARGEHNLQVPVGPRRSIELECHASDRFVPLWPASVSESRNFVPSMEWMRTLWFLVVVVLRDEAGERETTHSTVRVRRRLPPWRLRACTT